VIASVRVGKAISIAEQNEHKSSLGKLFRVLRKKTYMPGQPSRKKEKQTDKYNCILKLPRSPGKEIATPRKW
jgi:hypothetical protein